MWKILKKILITTYFLVVLAASIAAAYFTEFFLVGIIVFTILINPLLDNGKKATSL